MSRPIDRPKEVRAKTPEPNRRHPLAPMMKVLRNFFARFQRQRPLQPDLEPARRGEEHRLRLETDPKGQMELHVERRIDGQPVGRYEILVPHEVGKKGLHASYGHLSIFQETDAPTHAARLLGEVRMVFSAVASRTGRNIYWLEEPEHPLTIDALRDIGFKRRPEIKAGGAYYREFIHSAPKPELTEHQDAIAGSIVEHIRSQKKTRP